MTNFKSKVGYIHCEFYVYVKLFLQTSKVDKLSKVSIEQDSGVQHQTYFKTYIFGVVLIHVFLIDNKG